MQRLAWTSPRSLALMSVTKQVRQGSLAWLERAEEADPHSSPPRPLQDHIAADPCIGASYHYPCGKNAGKELEPHPNHSQTAMAHPGSGGRLLWGPLENKEKLCKLYLAT